MPSPPRLRVVVLIDTLGDIGGAEPLAAELIIRLPPGRFDRALVTYRAHTEGTDEHRIQSAAVARLRAAGVEVDELEGTGRWNLTAWRPFARRLRSGRVDVLHSHKFGPNLWASMFARGARVPVFVAHEHTWSFEGEPLRRLADRWAIATRADVVLAVSEADRANMMRLERIPGDRIRVLPNGIPTASAGPPGTLRRSLGVPADAPLVGTVAGLRPQKDLPTLVAAMADVAREVPDARLVIIGDGPERPALERDVSARGLADRILMPGFLPDAGLLAADFDVAVNCSTFEGSSLAIIEYMAVGRAVIATDVGGNRTLLGDGLAGVTVPPGQPARLSAALIELLRDPARRERLGAAAQARQRAEYDVAVQTERLATLYEELWFSARRTPAASA